MPKLFSQNRSFSRSHLSTIEKPRKQKKNPTQSTNILRTRNDSWLVSDSNKIISQVQTSSFAKKHQGQNSSFLQYSTISVLHRAFSLLTVLVLINNMISLQWSFDTQLFSINSISLTYTQKLSLSRIRKTKTFVTAPLSSIILPPFPHSPLKNTSYLDFGLQHHHPGIFIFQGIRSRENTEKYPSQWARFVCTQNHSSATTDSRKSISVVRLRQFEGNRSKKEAHGYFEHVVLSSCFHINKSQLNKKIASFIVEEFVSNINN